MSDPDQEKSDCVSFTAVRKKEFAAIRARKAILSKKKQTGNTLPKFRFSGARAGGRIRSTELKKPTVKLPPKDLSGLALSGGGIRSAAFSLGVLQGLAELGLLGRFDYLSTVSGGGYIGAWYSRWIHEEGQDKVLDELRSAAQRGNGTREPPEIRHIRDYSNFLTPQPGLFSTDGWTLIAIYLRNLILNQAVLLLAVIAVVCGVLATALVFTLVRHWVSEPWLDPSRYWRVLVPFTITIAAGARAFLVTMRRLAVEQPSGKPNPVAKQVPAGGIGSEPWFGYLLTAVGVAACSLQST